ncbi:kinesin-like protein KIF7 [Trichomycterus rosablanca]|uniref:kinesin-like protein KIF7 n=1 Tax=Trichomycterus rosablanca TaxID=2290929 RepID=UPI002F35FBBC
MKTQCLDDMSLETDEHLVLTLQEQRVRVQKREKQLQTEYNAAKEVFNSKTKSSFMQPGGKHLTSPGQSIKRLVKREHERLCALIAQHDELQFTVRSREVQLEQSVKSLELYNAPDSTAEMHDQRVRQLQNNLEKISLKITEGEKIHSTGVSLREHLQQEVRELPQALEKLHKTILKNHTELCKVAMMSQSAQAGLDTSKSMLLQIEEQLMLEQQVTESMLSEVEAEKEKQTGRRLDYQREEGGHITKAVHRMKEEGKKLIDPSAVQMAQQFSDQPGSLQSEVKLIESIDELKEALSCTDLQELVTCLMSQKAMQKRLLSQITKFEELVKQQREDLEAVELQYAQLKFTDGPGTERYKKQKVELEKKLCRKQERCNQWQSRLHQAQVVLQSIDQDFNNLYYRMTSEPAKGPPNKSSLDAIKKLSEIRAYLSSLGILPPDLAENQLNLGQDKMWGLQEQNAMMEPNYFRSVRSTMAGHATDESLRFCSQEDCSLTRDEIKRRGILLIEASQFKQNLTKAFKKS